MFVLSRRWPRHWADPSSGEALHVLVCSNNNVCDPEINLICNVPCALSSHLISLSKFNLPLIGNFTWPTPPGPYRTTTCRGRELNYGSHTYFFDHTRTLRASPDEWSAQCRGHLWDSTNMKDNTHQAHTQSSQQGEYGMMMTTAKLYSGTLGPKVSSHLPYRWGKTPKNLTQETCPDRGLKPGPLRDKHACYHLLHAVDYCAINIKYCRAIIFFFSIPERRDA